MNYSDLADFFKNDRYAALTGIEIIEAKEGYCRAQLKISEKHLNAVGVVQGGAIFTLADYAFAVASNSRGQLALAINVNITFLKGVSGGILYATATEFDDPRKLGAYDVIVTNEKNEIIAMPKSTNNIPTMPVLFLGHGSPMNAIEENEFVEGFRNAGTLIPKPEAILSVSAHWETRGTFVTAMEQPETIHDFGGFPKALYEVQYPAPGSPELANRIKSLITTATIEPYYNRGLDHGAWSVIKHLYPEADVPVIQMSLDHYKMPQYHYDLIKELIPLRSEGVLIIGSGNMVHNLRLVAWDKFDSDNFAFDWALEASEKMKNFILSNNHKSLINYRSHGKAFEHAIPTPEHYLPLLYVMALKDENNNVKLFNDKAVAGSITITSVKIG
jgi:4,5-DOPA dioxygenase extradiol